MSRLSYWALLIAVPAALAAPARAGFITFETVPGVTPIGFGNGTPVPTSARLSTQLQLTDGVSFTSTAGYIALVNLGVGHATSGANGIGGVDASNRLDYNSPITITFTMPGDPSAAAVTDTVSIRGDRIPIPGTATLQAFDINNVLIASQTVPDAVGLTLTVSAPGIHSVRLTETSSTIAFDDLGFGTLSRAPDAPTAVPSPPSLLLAFSGAALLGGGACRRRLFGGRGPG